MSKGFRYWGKESGEKFDLIELANTQRSITNFVKILTEKKYPLNLQLQVIA